jgi:hypothetical protein
MDFEAFPPEVSESVQRSGPGLRGTKTWEYVLIPRAPGTRTIPPMSLGYFDAEADAYRMASTEPLSLVVTGELPEGPSALVRGGVAALREDIRFIHLGSSGWIPTHRPFFRRGSFWLFLLLPMAAVLRRAGRIAHARLAEARKLATGESAREFYAEVARGLRGFVADKLDMAEAGMQMKDVEAALRNHGVSEEVMQEAFACLEHCDRQRFAPPTSDAAEEARFLKRVSEAMTDLSREMGR